MVCKYLEFHRKNSIAVCSAITDYSEDYGSSEEILIKTCPKRLSIFKYKIDVSCWCEYS
jgi:hypothetical protein